MRRLLSRGFDFIKGNQTIISSLMLIFVVVGALFLNSYVTLSRFQENLDRTLRGKALMAENIIEVAATDHLDNLSENVQLKEKLEKIKNEDEEISEISLLVMGKSGEYEEAFVSSSLSRSSQQQDDPQQKSIADNAKKFALSVNDAFAYLSSENGTRHWNVVKSLRDGEGKVAGLLLMKLSLASSDALAEKTIAQVYMLSILAVLVVLLLIFNHLRLFSFEVKARKLEEIDKMKDDFISMASHELRSPLTAISGYAELLSDTFSKKADHDLEDVQKKYLGNIEISVDRLKTLVEDLLDVSRIEQNRLPIEIKQVDAVSIITSSFEEMKVMAQEKNLQFTYDANPLPLVDADPERFKQILANLISNAIKYTPSGNVQIQTKEEEGWVYITVADTGMGISAANMQKLFSKFYRISTDKTKGITGTGLGLWIARQIAEKMGGSLDVESIEGVGSHFTLKLKKAKK